MTWFNNDDGFEAQNPRRQYVRRFWMPNDTERLITFVDAPMITLDGVQISTPFLYNEYRIQHNGSWNNWFTKPLNQDDDVLGQMEYTASKVAALTVVDHYEWEDKRGNKHKDELVLYVVKRSTPIWKMITKIIEREGSLAGKTYRVHRMGDKSAGTGVMLEKHDSNFQLGEQHQPFNYLEILKPRPKQELEAMFSSGMDAFTSQGATAPQQQAWANQPPQQNGFGQPQQQAWVNQTPQQNGFGGPADRVYGAVSNDDPVPF